MLATGLSAPTQSGVGIAAATVSPMISYEISQKFKELAKDNADGKLTEKQQAAHVLAHAVLGAAVAAAGGNDALAGALSAGGAEAVAPKVSTFLYGTADPEKLTAEQKDTVANIMSLAGAGVGVAVGNTSANAVSGSLNAESAVENNSGVLAIPSGTQITGGVASHTNSKNNNIVWINGKPINQSHNGSITSEISGLLDKVTDIFTSDPRSDDELINNYQCYALFGATQCHEAPIANSSSSNKKSSNNQVNNVSQATIGSPKIEPPDPDDENRSNIRTTHNSIKESPNYPNGFRDVQNGTRKVTIKNQSVLDDLRKVERGEWKKVYRDGFDGNGNKVSIHYFQNSRTGRVFNVKVKNYWSN